MSDETHNIFFNKNRLVLEMRFEGDNYDTASVKFRLEAKGRTSSLEESPAIPVKCLFDFAYFAQVSTRMNAIRIEQEIRKMEEFSKATGQSFQPIVEENKNGKEDQTK